MFIWTKPCYIQSRLLSKEKIIQLSWDLEPPTLIHMKSFLQSTVNSKSSKPGSSALHTLALKPFSH